MKIQLPYPYDGTAEHWFAQMRIVLKAAEKMYQEMAKDLGDSNTDVDGDHNPWIRFLLEDELQKKIESGSVPNIEEELGKKLYLEVDRLNG